MEKRAADERLGDGESFLYRSRSAPDINLCRWRKDENVRSFDRFLIPNFRMSGKAVPGRLKIG